MWLKYFAILVYLPIFVRLQVISGARHIELGEFKPRNCFELYESGNREDGIYTIYPDGKVKMQVLCDMFDGGWTVLTQRCKQEPILFNVGWIQYKNGFGDLNCSYWVGLENMNLLTLYKQMDLRVDMFNNRFDHYFIVYDNFIISPEQEKYRLNIGRKLYGTLSSDAFQYHNQKPFSTFDRDNDNQQTSNCASTHSAGWWYDACVKICLTSYDAFQHGNWMSPEGWRSFSTFQMKIKPSHVDA